VTIIVAEWTARIRAAAAQRFGFDPTAILVHATQTHTAPAVGDYLLDQDFPELPADPPYLRGGDPAYAELVRARAVEAIGTAVAALKPAQIGVGSAVKDGLAFNRRAITRQGKVIMPRPFSSAEYPLGLTEIRYLEGPIDPEVGVLCARDEQQRPIAMLLHYTCHPTTLRRTHGEVSADWPGAWAAEMQARHGAACVPLVLNGCCGNINPNPAFIPDYVRDHRRAGKELAASANAVIERMAFGEVTELAWKIAHISLPLRAADSARLRAAEQYLADHPRPPPHPTDSLRVDPQWFNAASIKSVELMRRRRPAVAYEIQVLRVGDTAFGGLPGEPFVEGQLAIKLGSPFPFTYLAHCTSEYVGYIPTRAACARGGHEADFSSWSKLAPDALDRIEAQAIGLLKAL
jgi:hypothetical protein